MVYKGFPVFWRAASLNIFRGGAAGKEVLGSFIFFWGEALSEKEGVQLFWGAVTLTETMHFNFCKHFQTYAS